MIWSQYVGLMVVLIGILYILKDIAVSLKFICDVLRNR